MGKTLLDFVENSNSCFYSEDSRLSFQNCFDNCKKISELFSSVLEDFSNHLGQMSSTELEAQGEDSLHNKLTELIHKSSEKLFGEEIDSKQFLSVWNFLHSKLEISVKLATKLNDEIITQDLPKSKQPAKAEKTWRQRAHFVKEEIVRILSLEETVRLLHKQLAEQEQLVSVKEKQISEQMRLYGVLKEKLDLSNKKNDELTQSGNSKQSEIERLKVYEEAFGSTKLENKKLQEELRSVKFQLLQHMKEKASASSSPSTQQKESLSSEALDKLNKQFSESISFLLSQNRSLRAKLARKENLEGVKEASNVFLRKPLLPPKSSTLSFLRIQHQPKGEDSSFAQLQAYTNELSKHLLVHTFLLFLFPFFFK